MSARSRAARLRVPEPDTGIHVPKVPKHVVKQYGSARRWKALKRQQLRAAIDAVSDLRMGSAFFPRYVATRYDTTLDAIQAGLTSLSTLLSEKVWGR